MATREYRLDVSDRLVQPGFLWGVTDAGLRIIDRAVQVALQSDTVGAAVLSVKW